MIVAVLPDLQMLKTEPVKSGKGDKRIKVKG